MKKIIMNYNYNKYKCVNEKFKLKDVFLAINFLYILHGTLTY